MAKDDQSPVQVAYQYRNRDPRLVWRGKEERDARTEFYQHDANWTNRVERPRLMRRE
jgi:hypothetical protein